MFLNYVLFDDKSNTRKFVGFHYNFMGGVIV